MSRQRRFAIDVAQKCTQEEFILNAHHVTIGDSKAIGCARPGFASWVGGILLNEHGFVSAVALAARS